MKTEIKYISQEFTGLRRKGNLSHLALQFQCSISAKDGIFSLLSSNIYTEKKCKRRKSYEVRK